MIAANLSKQQALDANPKAIQQIDFTANLGRTGNTRFYFILEWSKRNCFWIFTRNCKSFVNTISQRDLIFINIKMTQYSSLNVKLSNSQVNKLKSAIKNETDVVLRLSSNMISDNETNFHHKLLLTNRQVANLRKAFTNHLSADMKLSKTQLPKMIQSGGFLGRLLGPLLKAGLPLIKNVTKLLAKSVLIPLGLTAAAWAVDAKIHKKIFGSGHNSNSTTTLIIWNNEIEDIIEIVKSLEDSGLLLRGVAEAVQNEVKEQKGEFISMLLGILGASLLGNLFNRTRSNSKESRTRSK